VALYRSGKTQTFGWFVGQVMKKTGGRADPAAVQEALTRALGAAPPS
jgi:aspartyl-tRNA(Asn)/glutamyl-tRNA(Gln) amidotransferase subunit B